MYPVLVTPSVTSLELEIAKCFAVRKLCKPFKTSSAKPFVCLNIVIVKIILHLNGTTYRVQNFSFVVSGSHQQQIPASGWDPNSSEMNRADVSVTMEFRQSLNLALRWDTLHNIQCYIFQSYQWNVFSNKLWQALAYSSALWVCHCSAEKTCTQ